MHLTKDFYCPTFSMYLSDKSGENISIALLASAPVVAPVGMAEMKWWSDTQAGLARDECKTKHCFTPLYELRHVRHRHNRRATPSPERTSKQLCVFHRLSMGMVKRCQCTSTKIRIPVTLRKSEDSKNVLLVNMCWQQYPNNSLFTVHILTCLCWDRCRVCIISVTPTSIVTLIRTVQNTLE
ncbi:hypothetical protein BDR03DRAFT_394719 [Suillus americanus]|nr:hypothetical protein BDR03DRAFT_394719 [Suillus americanus]